MQVLTCPDCGLLLASRFSIHQCRAPKWKAGDLFFMTTNQGKIWRIHRVKGRTIWYIANHYGTHPPHGIIRKAYAGEPESWTKVERDYRA